MVKLVPQADAKSAIMGWFFDPGFIQNIQYVTADVENPSMEAIDSVLFVLREMGYIKTTGTCEHGFSVDECVSGMCELQTENADLLARVARLEEFAVYVYNSGYRAGHHETVEGRYIDIHPCDMDSFHAEDVRNLLEQAAQSE